jgi:hypothetical protein
LDQHWCGCTCALLQALSLGVLVIPSITLA